MEITVTEQHLDDRKTSLTMSPADRQLCARIVRALHSSGYLPLRDVQVASQRGRVALRGRVPSYYLKQIAQAASLAVDGVESLDNQIVVR